MKKFYKIPELRVDAIKFSRCGGGIDGCLADIIGGGVSSCHILKKSVDSRRGSPELIYSLIVESSAPPDGGEELPAADAAALLRGVELEVEPVVVGCDRPVVVGAGPAGMFAALVLAMAGARPLVLEAGRDVAARAADIAGFFASRRLDESSNYLIGEGGAGTFSDGKLYTRNRDERAAWVLRMFVEGGAAPDVLYLKRPHLGSDRLPGIVEALRKKIISLGGEFRFGATVDDILVKDGVCRGVRLAGGGGTIESPAVLLGCGLGGRRLVRRLMAKFDYELKGFQIGSRIEHPQLMVDRRQYRCERPATLGAAEYSLVMAPTDSRPGVSTFCMCPGGEIIPASAFEGELSSNGMSNYARSGEFANSTLVVTPRKMAFADGFAAFDFLDELGRRTFAAGGGDYTFPAQDAAGFLRGESRLARGAKSSARLGLRAADISALLPCEATASIREALKLFDRKFGGFVSAGRFVGVESYVSSPVRFVRGVDGMGSAAGFFPCGEGAGMAGGIMSAAVDGIDVAQKMIVFMNKKQKSEAGR